MDRANEQQAIDREKKGEKAKTEEDFAQAKKLKDKPE